MGTLRHMIRMYIADGGMTIYIQRRLSKFAGIFRPFYVYTMLSQRMTGELILRLNNSRAIPGMLS